MIPNKSPGGNIQRRFLVETIDLETGEMTTEELPCLREERFRKLHTSREAQELVRSLKGGAQQHLMVVILAAQAPTNESPLCTITPLQYAKWADVNPKYAGQYIKELCDADVLRKVRRGVYAVSPVILTSGKSEGAGWRNREWNELDKDKAAAPEVKSVLKKNVFDVGVFEEEGERDDTSRGGHEP